MITIGVDAHKRIHVAFALDEAGREIGEWRGPNSPSGWRNLCRWALKLALSVGVLSANSSAIMVKDILPGSNSDPDELTNVDGTLFFSAFYTGRELWKSDGTEVGTVMVESINPVLGHSDPQWLTDVDGTPFFSANDGVNGTELWKSDGTEEGTVLVKDIHPGPNGSSPRYLTDVNGTLFFSADDSDGRALWKSDGTEGSTGEGQGCQPDHGRFL